MILPVVCFNIVIFSTAATATPVGLVRGFKPSNIQNLEIVEGPKEFLVPVVPLAISESNTNLENPIPLTKPTDLDYMVYGKLYLMKMKAMKSEGFSQYQGNSALPDSLNGRFFRNIKSNVDEEIAFPATGNGNKARRSYQYKHYPLPNEEASNAQRNNHFNDHRRLEERSVDLTRSLEKPIQNTSSENEHEHDSTNIDEEAMELIQTLKPTASQIDGINHKNTEPRNNTGSNSTADNFDIDDRFLINVPNKPTQLQCPEGQKRTHSGTCKPIVKLISPTDGHYAGRVIAPNTALKNPQNLPLVNSRLDNLSKLQLTTLFRSVVQLEKLLEGAIKENSMQSSTKDAETSNSTSEVKIDSKKEA